jgi:hypothetical protein
MRQRGLGSRALRRLRGKLPTTRPLLTQIPRTVGYVKPRPARSPPTARRPLRGTLVGAIRAQQINLSAAGSGGAAEGLYLNLNGATMPTGTVLNVFVEWSEE